jgi:hypothetical protein
MEYDCIVITSYLKRNSIYRGLLKSGVAESDIKIIFSL